MQAYKVVDLLNKDDSFFSFDEFLKKINVKTNYLEYFMSTKAVECVYRLMIVFPQRILLECHLPNTNTCRKDGVPRSH